jgi:hypothetical protein
VVKEGREDEEEDVIGNFFRFFFFFSFFLARPSERTYVCSSVTQKEGKSNLGNFKKGRTEHGIFDISYYYHYYFDPSH